ncbi:adenylyl-sulfate kinase [Roseateles amylovorans]|uniref:Adenylyl-sulfate kinase n=1 Tax=Roseateles amylovorans TaxID=2978473 RepID=A0ABY6AVG8_9BURK|nr:adenylyl-sulfate kinase [Roseateles amylovorans]UXH76928.1 adenylyl-sulfate kinase [Roseateles amylovorans]
MRFPHIAQQFTHNGWGADVMGHPNGSESRAALEASVSFGRDIFKHRGCVAAPDRAHLLGQRPSTIWFTGLSGAGKSTLAYEMERRLLAQRHLSYVLDGDNLRHHLNSDLGFSAHERRENIRRTAEVASLMNEAGLIVFSALISPSREDRCMARAIIGDSRFLEVHMSADVGVCESRDPKGLYLKARAGLIPQFTGITSPYDEPEAPTLRIDTGRMTLDQAADELMTLLRTSGVLQ